MIQLNAVYDCFALKTGQSSMTKNLLKNIRDRDIEVNKSNSSGICDEQFRLI